MCWNAEISLNTFIFSLFATLFSYFNNQISVLTVLYILSFTSMQLVEYFIWEGYNNELFSKIGLLLVFIQPVLHTLSHLEFSLAKKIIFIYIILLLITITFIKPWNTINFKSSKAANGHLAWYWLDFPIYICILWFMFILFPLIYKKQYILSAVYTLIISLIYYTYVESHTWGSLFCWIANALSIQLIFLVFYHNFCSYKK